MMFILDKAITRIREVGDKLKTVYQDKPIRDTTLLTLPLVIPEYIWIVQLENYIVYYTFQLEDNVHCVIGMNEYGDAVFSLLFIEIKPLRSFRVP